MLTENPTFMKKVMFTDEAGFTNTRMINRQNVRKWTPQNTHWHREVPYQNPWRVNVWAGILGNHLVGPYFFEGNLTSERYAHLLENVLPGLLENIPLATRQEMWFQHDGAPAHTANAITDILDRDYPERWIGLRGPVEWPPRSPDLTPLDFFLWGTLKDRCYHPQPTTADDMCIRIREAFATIAPQILRRVREASMEKRLELCILNDGQHFEHMLKEWQRNDE